MKPAELTIEAIADTLTTEHVTKGTRVWIVVCNAHGDKLKATVSYRAQDAQILGFKGQTTAQIADRSAKLSAAGTIKNAMREASRSALN